MMGLKMHKKGISLVASSAVGALVIGVTLCAGGVSAVEQTGSATATVNVAVGSCSFKRSAGSGTYMGTLANGAAPISVTGSTFKTLCNDGGGYAVYAVGYSNDELGNTDLISNLGASDNIHTGIYVDSSSPSSWAMKLENNSSDYAPAVINNATGSDFTTFHAIPNNYTMVASYNGSTLDPSSGSNTGSTIKTTYQAYASYTQPAGTYTGQVKYTMVHPNDDAMTTDEDIDDIVYLQDFASLSNIERASVIDSMVEGQVYTRKDSRDNQDYTIAKLKDGKVWMTKNLNLAGGTELSSDTTDFASNYTLPTTNGWTVNNGKLVLPASAVKNSDNNDLTDSSQFSTNNYAYVYNSGNTTGCGASGQNIPCYSYYSWDVATLGSGRSISTDNTNVSYSICPKGWKLPSTYNGSGTAAEATDFRALMIALGGSNSIQTYNSSTSPTGAAMYNAIKAGTAPNFPLAGVYNTGLFSYGGSFGGYWSSTSGSDSDNARSLYFGSLNVYSAITTVRRAGFSVRCLLRQ